MVLLRGLYLTPDRYFLILLVPALLLGVARGYVRDFLPLVVLMIVYEELRGVAHLLSPDPYYAPQLDLDRWLFGGNVPTNWLQERLWDGSVSWWESFLAFLAKLHFIVPPTLLFLVWLRRRDLYYRFAATILGVSFAAVVSFGLWPAAPPWMAARDGWIEPLKRIGYLGPADSPIPSTKSWIYEHFMLRNEAAAVPSLHAGYSLLVAIFCWHLSRRLGVIALAAYTAPMWFSIVYFGEHYVSDVWIGASFALAGWFAVGRLIRRTRLAGPFPPPLSRARGGPARGPAPSTI